MHRGLYLLLALVAITNGTEVPSREELKEKIAGGNITDIKFFPYQISVRNNQGDHICGGVILSPRTVISAAHCFCGKHSLYTIRYGSDDVFSGKTVKISLIDIHDDYNKYTDDSDIALIHLAKDIEFGPNALPIALASQSPATGKNAVVSGWGLTTEGFKPRKLQAVKVQIVDHFVCRKQYAKIKRKITDSMLCAGVDGGGKDSCHGDSGGPIVVNQKLVGIVSWGRECGLPEFFGVYADIAYHRQWIFDKIENYKINDEHE